MKRRRIRPAIHVILSKKVIAVRKPSTAASPIRRPGAIGFAMVAKAGITGTDRFEARQ